MIETRTAAARRIGRLALLAPVAGLGVGAAAQLAGPQGSAARPLFVLLLSIAILAMAWTRAWRATFDRIAAALVERLGLLACTSLAALTAILASGPATAELLGCSLGFVLLGVAAAFEERARDPRRALGRIAIVGGWAVGFVALDLAIGRFVLPRRSHDKIFSQHDPVLGWRLRPDFSLERRDGGAVRRESTNNLGFRTPERPFEAAPGVKRVLVLGDSHSEGYTVGDDQTVAQLLDVALGPEVEVISLGVGGYSTDQELLADLEVGRRFDPDVVVLQVCANDVPFNVQDHYWRGCKPRFVRHGDLLMLHGVPVPDLKSSGLVPDVLAQHSAFFAFLEGQLRQVGIRRSVEQETDMGEAWQVTELLVRDLRRAVVADGARILAYDVDAHDATFDARVREVFVRQEVPYVAISPAYAAEFDRLWVSGHWNEEGQRRVADVLFPALRAALSPAPAGAVDGAIR